MYRIVTLCKVVRKGCRKMYGEFQSLPFTGRFLSTSAFAGRGVYTHKGGVKAFAFLFGQTDVSHHDALQGSRNRL